ncbi:hypothetical protein A6R68_07945 [Neotoma lepida]|uniref:BTB domain-containing protein n=1 Tax=Neotoma lepida TaxID=56216 RepID=A0A1A6GDY2_NEOLE|nr:hypothetical protein A6R68_07945 [Neotoma lepida]
MSFQGQTGCSADSCGAPIPIHVLTTVVRAAVAVRMAEEQEFAQLCKLPTQPPHSHCVSNTYRSTQHSQALLRGLLALRDSGILFDVVLVVEGRHIEAHRILLAASCDYFRGMFAGGLKEMEQEEVLIHGVSYNAMCQILHFIYTSELELSLNNVQETLVAACQLQIPEIIHFCCDFLMSWVDEENILDVYRLAELFDLNRLTQQLDTYILKNFVAFSRTDKYRQLPLEKVYSLLSSNRLEVSCETEVYEGALLYHYSLEQVQADQISLHEPPKLLETVRFPLMEAEVLQRLHDKLGPSPLRDTVASALMYHRNESLQPSLQGPQTELRSDFQCVVGFGGIHSTPSTILSDQAKYLNPLLGEWKHFTASLAPRMSNQGIAVLNNFVYLIGGDNNVQGFRAESRCWSLNKHRIRRSMTPALSGREKVGATLGYKLHPAPRIHFHQILKKLVWFLPMIAKMVKLIENGQAFEEALNSVGDKLVVVDFSAMWCGPCKMIKPFFHFLPEKYSSVVFLEVDVDDCQDVAAECEVKCMPTFQFYKKGSKEIKYASTGKYPRYCQEISRVLWQRLQPKN